MYDYVVSQLHFLTNTEKILGYIRSNRVHDNPPPEFSLNAIRSMPDPLFISLSAAVLSLSAWNVDLSSLNEKVRQAALSGGMACRQGEGNGVEVDEKIEAARKAARDAADVGLIDRAVSNYRQFGYFSQYDWRFANWGTVEDIHSVVSETFRVPSSWLEFTTRWTPPIAAMQELANTFPSVRFKLKYRYDSDDSWMVEDLFAFPPFGY